MKVYMDGRIGVKSMLYQKLRLNIYFENQPILENIQIEITISKCKNICSIILIVLGIIHFVLFVFAFLKYDDVVD